MLYTKTIVMNDKISAKGTLYTSLVPAAALFPAYYLITKDPASTLSLSLLGSTALSYLAVASVTSAEHGLMSVMKQKGPKVIIKPKKLFSFKGLDKAGVIAFAQYGWLSTTFTPMGGFISKHLTSYSVKAAQKLGIDTNYDLLPFLTNIGSKLTEFSTKLFGTAPLNQFSGDFKGLAFLLIQGIFMQIAITYFFMALSNTTQKVHRAVIVKDVSVKKHPVTFIKDFLANYKLRNIRKSAKSILGWGLCYWGSIYLFAISFFPLSWAAPVLGAAAIPFMLWLAKKPS